MSYYWSIESHGFNLNIGRILRSLSVLIDFDDQNIVKAILNNDANLFEALKEAYFFKDEIDAIQTFRSFNQEFCQGYHIKRALEHYDFNDLEKYKSQALIVLDSENACESSKISAQLFLNALNGIYPDYIPTQQDLINRKQERYNSSRAKWLKLLIERDGYVCEYCDSSHNLRIKHLLSIQKGGDTKMENLKLRCAKCINKK